MECPLGRRLPGPLGARRQGRSGRKMPCRRVTSCIFGGPDLDVLYITTVRYGLSAGDLAEQPLAGGIFALDAGVKGIPDGEFAARPRR